MLLNMNWLAQNSRASSLDLYLYGGHKPHMGLPRTVRINLKAEVWHQRVSDHSVIEHATSTLVTSKGDISRSNYSPLHKPIPPSSY